MVTAHASRLATLRLFDARPAVDERLEAAMRHGLLVGGKRLRPLLVYLAGQALGASDDALDAPAAAIELIHAYRRPARHGRRRPAARPAYGA